ncbi:hypothetical protein BT96DRAFT_988539 [Gymnopus androsaceus JB14]|uniref:Apple domain-containing protein n=1 Tax=Gymnopus androsaceus JB14 TaxID=1447944 RepID=A0A6A4I0J0_9AGAR|nr:hypothetical protein BT96DRAFT_988539 [Gymnopus androsaceus JB14]
MRSFLVLVALATSALAVYIHPLDIRQDSESTESMVASLAASNHYGAPNPPSSPDGSAASGWYYGDDPGSADNVPWLKDEDLCAVLAQNPQALQCPDYGKPTPTSTYSKPSSTSTPTQPPPPPPTGTYYPVFSGLDAAIEAPDYLTYGLVDTVSDCEAMCDTVSGCIFINTYHDVNGKNGSPLLTCSLYSQYHTSAQAINTGGQTQPDGSIDFITDSAGYDKSS